MSQVIRWKWSLKIHVHTCNRLYNVIHYIFLTLTGLLSIKTGNGLCCGHNFFWTGAEEEGPLITRKNIIIICNSTLKYINLLSLDITVTCIIILSRGQHWSVIVVITISIIINYIKHFVLHQNFTSTKIKVNYTCVPVLLRGFHHLDCQLPKIQQVALWIPSCQHHSPH